MESLDPEDWLIEMLTKAKEIYENVEIISCSLRHTNREVWENCACRVLVRPRSDADGIHFRFVEHR